MICPDCNKKMIKSAIECEDMSGFFIAWICECDQYDENIQLKIHAKDDWTTEILY